MLSALLPIHPKFCEQRLNEMQDKRTNTHLPMSAMTALIGNLAINYKQSTAPCYNPRKTHIISPWGRHWWEKKPAVRMWL